MVAANYSPPNEKKENHNLEGWDGVGGGREVHEGGDICIPMTDSC